MANPHRGEVEFKIGESVRTLRLNTNAICELEDDLKLTYQEILVNLARFHITTARAVLCRALPEHPTLDEATAIIDEAGPHYVVQKLGEAFDRAFPDVEDAAGTDNPPVAEPAGIGATTSPIGLPAGSPSKTIGGSRRAKSNEPFSDGADAPRQSNAIAHGSPGTLPG